MREEVKAVESFCRGLFLEICSARNAKVSCSRIVHFSAETISY